MTSTANGLPEPSYILARLNYEPETGDFFWKPIPCVKRYDNRWNVRWAGKPAGSLQRVNIQSATCFYRVISVDYSSYMAHRLAWVISTGEWPDGIVDHADRNSLNNRISNLRIVTPSQNVQNATIRKDNTSGYKGVSKDPYTDKWLSQIWVTGKHHRVGLFATKEEAFAAYCEAGKRLHGEYFSAG